MDEKTLIENDILPTEELKKFEPSRDEKIRMLLNRALDNSGTDSRSKKSLIEEALELLKPVEEVIEDTLLEAEELLKAAGSEVA